MHPHRSLSLVVLLGLASAVRAQVAANEELRLVATLPSPWGAPLAKPYPAGTPLHVAKQALQGPQPLTCTDGRYIFLHTPAAGLFEGNLPNPPEQSAQALGLPQGVVTQRISCPNAGFDIHRAADGRAWIGLDNAVLRWDRVSIDASPEATVQSLLVQHFANGMSLSTQSIESQSAWLSPTLTERFQSWFAREVPSDEVPELNGDPFTDSQEPPDRFELAAARVQGAYAELTVTFSGEAMQAYPVQFLLTRTQGVWRIEDLRYRDGELLSRLLAQ